MTTVDLTAETFADVIGSPGITLVDWWASWCGPCRQFAPVYEAASENHPDITFGTVDTEAEQQLSAAARITSIPTLMVFRDGILVFSRSGSFPGPALERIIQAARKLDMDDVRRLQAEQQGAAEPAPAGE